MDKIALAKKRRKRVRVKIHGSSKRPRLSVRITNRQVIAQLIDDEAGRTLAYVATIAQKALADQSLTKKAEWAGQAIAKSAVKLKIKKVVFDRGSHLYHSRLIALASAARQNGLDF